MKHKLSPLSQSENFCSYRNQLDGVEVQLDLGCEQFISVKLESAEAAV